MFYNLYHSLLFDPLYNALVWLAGLGSNHSVGLAIIVLTIFVRLLILPITHRASVMQKKIKHLDPAIRAIRDKHKSDKQAQTMALLNLYREHGINPVSSFLGLLIQLPILIALFNVFRTGFETHPDYLYSFVFYPTTLDTVFLGFIDLTHQNWQLALLVAVSQFLQFHLAVPPLSKNEENKNIGDFQADFGRVLNKQMRYVMPALTAFIAGTLPAAISLYWITSNFFSIIHELWVRRNAKDLLAPKSLQTDLPIS